MASERQINLLNTIQNNDCVFLTGGAGTGKTTLLKQIYPHLTNYVVLAPTGIASINANGQTIHSFFKLGQVYLYQDDKLKPENIKQTFTYTEKDIALFLALEYIVIDEVSMVSANLLDTIDNILRSVRNKKQAFGGVKMILVGDLCQLPPVQNKEISFFLSRSYGSDYYFFEAKVFKKQQASLSIFELTKVHRQNNKEYQDNLNKIRKGNVDAEVLQFFNQRLLAKNALPLGNYISLCSTNKQANYINEEALAKNKNKKFTYHANLSGEKKFVDALIDEVLAPQELALKVGCGVMILKNDKERRYVNGSIATVSRLDKDFIELQLDNGNLIELQRAKWNKEIYRLDEFENTIEKKIVASFEQFPVKICNAITIHKAQGMTISGQTLIINNTDCVFYGTGYVALSRNTNFENLHLAVPLGKEYIKTHERVLKFYKYE